MTAPHTKTMIRSACWTGLRFATIAGFCGLAICLVGLQQFAELLGLSAREPADAIKSIGLILVIFAFFGFIIGTGYRLWKQARTAESGTAPNVGPAASSGSSAAKEGPPSVS